MKYKYYPQRPAASTNCLDHVAELQAIDIKVGKGCIWHLVCTVQQNCNYSQMLCSLQYPERMDVQKELESVTHLTRKKNCSEKCT